MYAPSIAENAVGAWGRKFWIENYRLQFCFDICCCVVSLMPCSCSAHPITIARRAALTTIECSRILSILSRDFCCFAWANRYIYLAQRYWPTIDRNSGDTRFYAFSDTVIEDIYWRWRDIAVVWFRLMAGTIDGASLYAARNLAVWRKGSAHISYWLLQLATETKVLQLKLFLYWSPRVTMTFFFAVIFSVVVLCSNYGTGNVQHQIGHSTDRLNERNCSAATTSGQSEIQCEYAN